MKSQKQVKAVSAFTLIIFPVVLVTTFSMSPKVTDFHGKTLCSSANSSSVDIKKIADDRSNKKISLSGIINTTGAKYSYRTRTSERNETAEVKIIIDRPEFMPLPGCVSGDWRTNYYLNISLRPETEKIRIVPEFSGDYKRNFSVKTLHLNNSN